MTKTTNFFSELRRHLEHSNLTITLAQKGDQISVQVMPDAKESAKLPPLVFCGTADELDEGFIPQLNKSISPLAGLKTNSDQFLADVAKAREDLIKEKAKKPPTSQKPKPKDDEDKASGLTEDGNENPEKPKRKRYPRKKLPTAEPSDPELPIQQSDGAIPASDDDNP